MADQTLSRLTRVSPLSTTNTFLRLRRNFPWIEEIERILLHLRGLRQEVEETFPDARAFLRPGFDKIDLNG